jgi:UDPglucose 6-dehydrogenase
MQIAMIGTGYVGLVSGACLADFGHHVVCVDKDPEKISLLRVGKSPIFEPGLDELIAGNTRAGRLVFTLELAKSVAAADAVFIAVGPRPGAGTVMPISTSTRTREIAEAVDGFTVIITKSTVPVGTGDEVAHHP